MPGLSNNTVQIKTGFFHALSTVLTKSGNPIGNEKYKSAHSVRTNEIWTDNIEFAGYTDVIFDNDGAFQSALDESSTNPAVTVVGSVSNRSVLYPLANTDYETWFFDTGTPSALGSGFLPSSGWVKPLISPSSIVDSEGNPSVGYSVRLYRPTGEFIDYALASYDVDYYSGLVKFDPNKRPIDPSNGLFFQLSQSGLESALSSGFSTAKQYLIDNNAGGIVFQYTGQYLSDLTTSTDLYTKAHSFSKLRTNDGRIIDQNYKSSHTILPEDIWLDESPYVGNLNDALSIDDISVNQIGTPSNAEIIYPLSGSNYEVWFLDSGDPTFDTDGFLPDNRIRPLISPVDVINNDIPSFGYEAKLYDRSDNLIDYYNAYYDIDYYSGFILFEPDKTPINNDNGLNLIFNSNDFINSSDKLDYIRNLSTCGPRALAWQYVGQTLDDLTLGLSASSGITISNDEIAVNIGTQSGLTFSQDDRLSINVDDETIKINQNNQIYVSGKSTYEWSFPNITSGSEQPTGVTIGNTPLSHSTVKVMVNGQVQILGGSTNYLTSDCYFYDGVSVKDIDDISVGDELYWNGNITNYNLSNDDKILFIYEF